MSPDDNKPIYSYKANFDIVYNIVPPEIFNHNKLASLDSSPDRSL